jgi:EmrB/QacA subfamily drug resistance transporter
LKRLFAPENRHLLIAVIVAFALFMELLDASVIATALPQMAVSFHENPVNLSIGMSAYMLTLAIFIPSSGWFADRYGSKRIFITAIVTFTAASVLCGFSNALWEFTAARILQGIGGAMMVPVGRLVVLRGSGKEHLINAMQFLTTPALVAPVLGPPIGGFITTFSSWRWIFFLNVPIGILGLALVVAFMVEHRAAERRSFDTLGFLTIGSGMGALLFGIDLLGRPALGPAFTGGLIAGGALLCALGIAHLRRTAHPLIDLSLFRIPTFAQGALLSGNAFRIVVGATPLLWPLLFQVDFGMSAFASGALIIACAAGDLTMKLFAVRVLRRFGFRKTLVYNGLLVGLAVLACATWRASTPVALIAATLVVIGIVRSVEFGAFNALTYVDVPPEQMSAATSLAGTLQQMSFGLGVAFAALALNLAAQWNHGGTQTFTVDDFRVAFFAAAAVAFAGALGFSGLHPRAGAEASGQTETAWARRQKSPKASPG